MSARSKPSKTAGIKPGTIENDLRTLVRRHLKMGWWSLLVFLILGIVLESLHGFKVGWYLNVSNSNRRTMLTLAHAHGTVLGLLHIAFASTLPDVNFPNLTMRRLASNCLAGAGVLVPAGFFLGGLTTNGEETGLGIILVPVGALLLVAAVVLTARGAGKASAPSAV